MHSTFLCTFCDLWPFFYLFLPLGYCLCCKKVYRHFSPGRSSFVVQSLSYPIFLNPSVPSFFSIFYSLLSINFIKFCNRITDRWWFESLCKTLKFSTLPSWKRIPSCRSDLQLTLTFARST